MLLFILLTILVGGLFRSSLKKIKLPYTVLILFWGLASGFMYHYTGSDNMFYENIRSWSNIDPHMMLYIFIPPLLFEAALSLDFHIFKKSMKDLYMITKKLKTMILLNY